MNKLTEWVKSHKPHTAGIIVAFIAVITLSVAGMTGVFSEKTAKTPESKNAITAVVPTDTTKTPVEINVAADEKVTEASTPVIMHVESTDKRKEPVDFYHAVDSGVKTDTVEVSPGEYKITVTGVINNDGSVAKPETKTKEMALSIKSTDKSKESENKADVKVNLDKTIPADKVTDADIKDIADVTKKAIEKGDESLKGDAGKAILEKVETNAKANANISEESKEAVEKSTKDATKATETKPETTVTTAPSSASKPAPKPETKPTSKPEPKKKTGHYETRTKTVKVPRQVTEQVLVKAAWDERVFSHYVYHFAYDGFETTDENVCDQHGVQLAKQGVSSNYTEIPQYKTINHPAEYKTVTKTVYDEKTETYQVWVED